MQPWMHSSSEMIAELWVLVPALSAALVRRTTTVDNLKISSHAHASRDVNRVVSRDLHC